MKTYRDIAADGGSGVAAQVAARADRLRARMASVRHVVAVMSGKGGVGKSSVTVGLASALAAAGAAVGIVDADVNGPSVAQMTGVRGQPARPGPDGIVPAIGELGLKIMSMDLFLPDDRTPVVWEAPTQRDAYTWRGTMEAAALREFLSDTEWGSLDYLFIDLPPGADRLPTVVDMLPTLSGAVVVTLPTDVARLVVGRSVELAREIQRAPVLGVLENMAAYVCPHCGEEGPLFPEGGGAAIAEAFGVPLLGRIPFDPRLAAAADAGELFLLRHGDTPAGRALRAAAERVGAALAG